MAYGYGRRHHSVRLLDVFAAFAWGAIALFVVPGVVVTFVADRALGLALDRGQFWTFAVSVSVGISTVSIIASGGFWRGLARYFVACVLVTWMAGLSGIGFHAEWPLQLWRACWGSSLGTS